MKQLSQMLRRVLAILVIVWAVTIVETELSHRFTRDPFAAPTPPYVSVSTAHPAQVRWVHWLWDAGQKVVTFIRFPN